jgi:pimeloyl-ACP methyl ester carboxylesterase
VLAGDTDYVLPPEIRRAVAKALPNADIRIARGGHISPHEDPEATEVALRELLVRAENSLPKGA